MKMIDSEFVTSVYVYFLLIFIVVYLNSSFLFVILNSVMRIEEKEKRKKIAEFFSFCFVLLFIFVSGFARVVFVRVSWLVGHSDYYSIGMHWM